MVAYEEFIEKLKLFLNNSNKLLFNENGRKIYTNEEAEKIEDEEYDDISFLDLNFDPIYPDLYSSHCLDFIRSSCIISMNYDNFMKLYNEYKIKDSEKYKQNNNSNYPQWYIDLINKYQPGQKLF